MEEKNKTKRETDSLTAVSHHVKGPVYVLKGYLEALLSGDVGYIDDNQKKYLEVCLKSVERVNSNIESLIYAIKIEDGSYEIKKEKVDVIEVVKKVVEGNKALARAANTTLSLNAENDSLFAITDFKKLEEVLCGFVMNAIKYKDSGEGIIEITVKEKDGEIFCCVKDNGIGVSDEDKKKIFDKFYRTKKGIEKDPNNLGLQLYISRVIIEDSGGKIWVEDNNEGGATFCFTLPVLKEK